MRRPRFEELDHQETPIGAVSLRRRIHPSTGEDVYEVKLDDDFLMSSTFTAAEVALARMALDEAPDRPLRVVVGGLGLGYTAAAALDDPRVADLLVIDALAPVIGWHRDHLVPLGRRLTQDPRCRLLEGDFFTLASGGLGGEGQDPVDVVLVDIDHSPQHLLNARHAPFYEIPGIREVADQLRPGGVFALWSDDPPDEAYLARLRAVMPDAQAHVVRFPDATGDREATNTVYIAIRVGPDEAHRRSRSCCPAGSLGRRGPAAVAATVSRHGRFGRRAREVGGDGWHRSGPAADRGGARREAATPGLESAPVTATLAPLEVREQAARRRSIAVISHPDAGKSTLTEAIALHARAIENAGAVHGRSGRSGVVSDWLEMEQSRGISVTSAALVFEVGDTVVNLLDTPGHADFSEDTYRVLTAVDAAIMLLDASRGLEPQTLKLFEVCRRRGVPVLTFVNKWDRPGRDALALCDELEQRIGLPGMPLTWPVGEAGRLLGLLDPATGEVRSYERAAGGASKASERLLDAEERQAIADDVQEAEDAAALLPAMDLERFLRGEATPLLFGAALTNIGVRQLLDAVLELAPSPGPRSDTHGEPRPIDAPFSGFVFKMQSGMDPQHRDHLAFVRVCSGRFERGMMLQHERTGRPFATKYALSVFGRERSTVEVAYPGDVVGLVNAAVLAVGDTVHDPAGPSVTFPPMPAFAPEHFAVASVRDPGRSKQFRRAIAQLQQEGVVQVLLSERGDARPVLAAVGPLQLEVATFRLEREFGAPADLERLSLSVARLVEHDDRALVSGYPGSEVVSRADGTDLALFRDIWHLRSFRRGHPSVTLRPLMADSTDE